MKTLIEGQKAPSFKGKDQNGNFISLADFKRKKVAIFFYPQDDTPTCTIQACNLRDNYDLLKNEGFEVIGISPDNIEKHKKFETKYNLPYTIIADESHAIINKFFVWGEKKLYGKSYLGLHRTTFLIDEKGIIRKIILRPKNKDHAAEIIKCWKEIVI